MHHWTLLTLVAALAACNGKDDDTESGDDIIPQNEDSDTDEPGDDTDTQDTDTDEPVEPVSEFCEESLVPANGTVVEADADLFAAIANAPDVDAVLLLAPGFYDLTKTLPIDKELTLVGQSGNSRDVVLRANGVTGNVFEVTASDVTLAHFTVQDQGGSAVHIAATDEAITNFRMHDVSVLNSGAYGVFVDGGSDSGWPGVDNSSVTCSRFELQDTARNNQEGCERGAIDALGTRGWVVRDNRIIDMWCDTVSPAAVRFYRGSRGATIIRNTLVNTPLGIVVGQTQDDVGRTYSDLSSCESEIPGVLQSEGAFVANNIVSSNEAPEMTAGILAESSCNVTIVHNSVYTRDALPTPGTSSIEHGFEGTSGVIANNLCSHTIRANPGTTVDVNLNSNRENAQESTWEGPAYDDFRTSPGEGRDLVEDQGIADFLLLVPTDIEGEPRDDAPDIGADEFVD